MMCSTRQVTPEASGMGSKQVSSRTVNMWLAQRKDPNVVRISTPKSVRVFANKYVDHQADWMRLGNKAADLNPPPSPLPHPSLPKY